MSGKVSLAIGRYAATWHCRVLTLVLRLVVGATFMGSGFVKAIDPTGSYYKFCEYASALGFDHLLSFTLFAAFALAAVEFVLGLMLVVGACRRGVPCLLLALMAVMLPLTLWLAVTNAVPDCGCFGDAWVISNWASFWKNVAIVVGLLYLTVFNKRLQCVYGPAVQWVVMLVAFVYIMSIAIIGYATQPLIDFRPYKVGTKLVADDAAGAADSDFVFIYEKDGVQRQFSIDSLPGDDWNFVDRRLAPGRKPQAQRPDANSIAIYDQGTDVTADVLDPSSPHLLILFPDLPRINISYSFVVNELYDFAQARGVTVDGLASATSHDVAEWTDISMASYPIYEVDDSQLKMLARGNPAVVYVDSGRIVWKRTLNSIDTQRLADPSATVSSLGDGLSPRAKLAQLTTALAVAMLVLFVVNRFHRAVLAVYRLVRRRIKKAKKRKSLTTNEK